MTTGSSRFTLSFKIDVYLMFCHSFSPFITLILKISLVLGNPPFSFVLGNPPDRPFLQGGGLPRTKWGGGITNQFTVFK